MTTNLSLSPAAQLETECLVVVARDRSELDRTEKSRGEEEKRDIAVESTDSALLGGGTAKSFSAFELRRLAGVAVRTLKSRGLRSFAFVAPETAVKAEDAVKAIVEGAFVGNFDPDTY